MVAGPSLSPKLLAAAQRAEEAAHAAGLTFFDVVFEMLDAADVNAIAAYGGFPVRYSSWRFGMEYERLARGHDWGLSKIYELVINHDPTVAYLVRSNSFMEQKLVMAHVFGHADFFRNNAWFKPTERSMLERFDEHARSVSALVEVHGTDHVERLIDRALSLETLVDPYGPMKRSAIERAPRDDAPSREQLSLHALEAIMDGGHRAPRGLVPEPKLRTHARSTFDVLRFLIDEAPLEDVERALLEVVASEAEYFLPQRMTKIINEGWASFWHSRLLTTGLLDSSEIVDFADCHSGATAAAPGQLNPYKLGIDLFRHAETRDLDLFRLRSMHNDVTFIDEVMDAEFIAESKLFRMAVGQQGRGSAAPVVGSRDPGEVKESLLAGLAWGGQPRIRIEDVDAGALVLRHEHDGRDLKLDDASEMLKAIEELWRAPVHLITKEGEEGRQLVSEGLEVRMTDVAA